MSIKRNKLNVEIRRKKVAVSDNKSIFLFRIVIDGDVFWARNYQSAICLLLEVLTRDELKRTPLK